MNLVLLHGWGCDSSIWAPLLPGLEKLGQVITIDLPGFGAALPIDDYDLDTVLDFIAQQLPNHCIVIGWSLGGMLGVQLATRFPQKITSLITIAANIKFTANDEYPSAMAVAVHNEFIKKFINNPQATLNLFFNLLTQGDHESRQLLKLVRRLSIPSINTNWLAALVLLAELDNRQIFAQLSQPGLHVLASADALVPVSAAKIMNELNPRHHVVIIENCAHIIHWSQPERLLHLIENFLFSSVALRGTVG